MTNTSLYNKQFKSTTTKWRSYLENNTSFQQTSPVHTEYELPSGKGGFIAGLLHYTVLFLSTVVPNNLATVTGNHLNMTQALTSSLDGLNSVSDINMHRVPSAGRQCNIMFTLMPSNDSETKSRTWFIMVCFVFSCIQGNNNQTRIGLFQNHINIFYFFRSRFYNVHSSGYQWNLLWQKQHATFDTWRSSCALSKGDKLHWN